MSALHGRCVVLYGDDMQGGQNVRGTAHDAVTPGLCLDFQFRSRKVIARRGRNRSEVSQLPKCGATGSSWSVV